MRSGSNSSGSGDGMSTHGLTADIDRIVSRNAGTAHVTPHATPVEVLMAIEEYDSGEDAATEAEEAMRESLRAGRMSGMTAALQIIFQDGPHPLEVLRNAYAICKALRPELIDDMSMEDIAFLSGDAGKATVSARVQRIYTRPMQRAGSNGRASCQKSGNYSDPQLGNSNRTKKGGKGKGAR